MPHFAKRSTLLIAALSLLITIFVSADGQARTVRKIRNIMVLHSYHQGLQWADRISEGIQSVLKKDFSEIEIHYEYLDTKRNPGEDYFKKLVAFERYKTKLASIRFDAIIACDNNALRFLVDFGDEMFPETPIVFCGINNFTPELLNGKTNITGVVEQIDYQATLDIMHSLHPNRNRIMVIVDETVTGAAIKKEFMNVVENYDQNIHFEFYQDFVLEDVEDDIAKLDDSYLIYLLTFNRDREGKFISYVDGINMIKRAASVPIYGSWEFYFGRGIVGGMITSGFYQGQQAALMVERILKGDRVSEIPIMTQSPNKYMFDQAQMTLFGVPLSALPRNSRIINKSPSFWEQNKRFFLITLIFAILVVIIMSWRLAAEKRKQIKLEKNNKELDRRVAEQTSELHKKNKQLKKEIAERLKIEKELRLRTKTLEEAFAKIKTLSGFLPICASCKKIRDDQGYWNQLESYIDEHSDATFSHSICPDCAQELYPELYENS